MFSKRFTELRFVLAAVAICALAGCAQFEDSFGEITELYSARSEPVASFAAAQTQESDVPGTPASSDNRSERNLLMGGLSVRMNDGRVTE